MKVFSPGLRVGLAILALVILVAIWFGPAEQVNMAQERPVETPKAKLEKFSKRDEVTNDIRDRSKEIVRVEFHSMADREKVSKYGRIVQDFGSSALIAKSKATNMSRSGLDVQKVDTSIHVPSKKFDPIE